MFSSHFFGHYYFGSYYYGNGGSVSSFPTFPAYMPSPMLSGFKHSPDFSMLVTQMDAGPDKQRPRNSTAIIQRAVQYGISLENRQLFEAWVRDTLFGGSLFFNWPDPLSLTSKLGRIVGGKVDYTPDSAGTTWILNLVIETYG